MTKIDFFGSQTFFEIDVLEQHAVLRRKVLTCIEAQKKAGAEMLKHYFRPNPHASYEVSTEALARHIASHAVRSDIRADRTLSNCIAFNSRDLEGSVMNDRLLKLRRETDRQVASQIKKLFQDGDLLSVADSGHFWYPPGGYHGVAYE